LVNKQLVYTVLRHKHFSRTKVTRKLCYRKETAQCSMFFLRPMTLIVICFSLRKVKAVICRLKADLMCF